MRKIFFLLILIFSISIAFANDWSHWRGPFLNGSSDVKELPSSFTKTENIKWVKPLPGPAAATPIIFGSRVFINSTDKNSEDLLALSFDTETGKQFWKKKLSTANFNVRRNTLASPSPVADNKRIYFIYGNGSIFALNHDGTIIWERDLAGELGPFSLKYGYSSSPLLYDNTLYIILLRRDIPYSPHTADKPLESYLIALDTETGKTIFKHLRKSDALNETLDSYSSPVVFKNKGDDEIVLAGADYLTAHHPKTGAEVWRYQYDTSKNEIGRNIPTPIVVEDMIFVVKTRGTQTLALRVNGEKEIRKPELVWTCDRQGPDSSSPLYYDGKLYIVDDRKQKAITCLDAKTGAEQWQGRLESKTPYYASFTAGDGKIYGINEDAQVIILDANARQLKILAKIDLGEEPTQASIALADGALFIRTAENLYCAAE
jgi:outer membrane protein assembly factor BamB